MTIWDLRIEDTDVPRYRAIADAIARDMAAGLLPGGTRLPTHRELAERLGVTVGTVTRGYAEAERRGLTVGEVGRGTFVRAGPEPEGFGWRDAAQEGLPDGLIDMSLACPWIPPDGTHGRELASTLTEIARGGPLEDLLRYAPATATARHRAAAASWHGRLGLDVSPDQIVVTNGAQHGMLVVLAAMLRSGDTVATAELTYPGFKAVAQMLGLRLAGIAMDDEGVRPDALAEACVAGAIRALYCVPTIQNPTAATMSESRRRAIAEVARRHDLLVIEDEFQVGLLGERLPPVAAFAPERTFHITTLSKWVTFGLRVGFVAAPPRAVERVRSGVRSSLWQVAPLMVEVATRWIADGTAERLGRRQLVELEARHRIVRDLLGDRFDVRTDPRSLHVWVRLPEPFRSDECVARARQRGVLIAGAEAFAVGRDVPHAVRISIAQVPEQDDVRRGLRILADILDGSGDPCVDIL
jgi:DNA-binding transcriptional MocR family regulator